MDADVQECEGVGGVEMRGALLVLLLAGRGWSVPGLALRTRTLRGI